jgi:hypothetical protein
MLTENEHCQRGVAANYSTAYVAAITIHWEKDARPPATKWVPSMLLAR